MKIIFDTEKPATHRVVFVTNKGIEFPMPCYWIQIADEFETASYKLWGNQKERERIVEKWKDLVKMLNLDNSIMTPKKTVKKQ